MPAPTSSTLLALALAAIAGLGCGSKIGDACAVSSDCANDGSRLCDTTSPGGHCTVVGCDFGTCPDDAVCVRFFPAFQGGRACSLNGDCEPDEVCTVAGAPEGGRHCAPRSIEERFCMSTCGGDGDCRAEYECRTSALMRDHGGEPVPDPDRGDMTIDESRLTRFCAARAPCEFDADCATNEICDSSTRVCVPR